MIAAFRKKKGYSQAELARLIGVGQSTVAMWENGTNTPRPDKLLSMSKLFGCTIEELMADGKNDTREAV